MSVIGEAPLNKGKIRTKQTNVYNNAKYYNTTNGKLTIYD